MRIYTLRGKLKPGDMWSQVSWLLQRRRVALAEQTFVGHGPVRAWVIEIAELFDTDATISFVPGHGGWRPPAKACFRHEYLPTRERWSAGDDPVVCVQLDGRWQSDLKNPTPAERERLVSGLEAAGYRVKAIGQPMTLAQCVTALATCHCFIGVDSGMMHVANSVRCPRILIRNRMYDIDCIYGGKALMMAENADAALRLLA